MTLGRVAAFVTVAMTVVSLALFIGTGGQTRILGMLAAPIPALIVYGLLPDWADWRLSDLLRRRDADAEVDRQLGEALEPPLQIAPPENDAFFVPGVPRHPEDT